MFILSRYIEKDYITNGTVTSFVSRIPLLLKANDMKIHMIKSHTGFSLLSTSLHNTSSSVADGLRNLYGIHQVFFSITPSIIALRPSKERMLQHISQELKMDGA
jgi:hypothetical protein